MPTTLRLSLDGFPCGPLAWRDGLRHQSWGAPEIPLGRSIDQLPIARAIPLRRAPVVSVQSFTYVDDGGTQRDLVQDTDYLLDAESEPGRLTPAYGKDWPIARVQVNAVQVEYVAGYANAAAVPRALKQAMLQLVCYWKDNPNAAAAPLTEQPFAVRTLINTCALPEVW